jgi:Xaa-Pro aminopeptidase
MIVGGIRGAPFVLTGSRTVKTMTALANIQPGEKAADLGSGDGRILIAIARAGAEAHGYEINPFLVLWSRGDAAAQRFGSEIQGGRIGHGQGLDYSERPFLLAGSTETLKPGHVFVLHVCLALPGTNILINPIADLCHVTEDGVEVITRFPRDRFHG